MVLIKLAEMKTQAYVGSRNPILFR